MERDGGDWIVHGLYEDDMIHASPSNELEKEFIAKYTGRHHVEGHHDFISWS